MAWERSAVRTRQGPHMGENRRQRRMGKGPEGRGPGSGSLENADNAVYGFILRAMEHFAGNGGAIDEASLVRICIAGGCKSGTMARSILDRMVQNRVLNRQVNHETGERSYYINPPTNKQAD